jgi:succinyl-CoA synthetase beta subunit
MKIHEYQAKELFRRHGVAVPEGAVAFSLEEAGGRAAASKWPGTRANWTLPPPVSWA